MNSKTEISLSIWALSLFFIFGSTMCKNKTNNEVINKFGEFIPKVFSSELGEIPYQVLFPKQFYQKRRYPLVIFLHGSGERGTDNQLQLKHGSKLFKDSTDQYPAVVLFPQCPKEDYWVPLIEQDTSIIFQIDNSQINPSLKTVMDLIESYLEKDYIDSNRVYLVGLSMGGMGVWELLWRMPQQFSAAIPICGVGSVNKSKYMLHTPIRVYHGELDDVIHNINSKRMVESIQQMGGQIEYIEYPEIGHLSWINAFQEDDFLSWLFAQSK